jgi:primosomal protein N' (replication factor Y)
MDRDTMTGKMAHATMLDDFSNNKYDILLGTQMVAKGHDIKNVTGVGIISADAGLNIPDFRAAERCFSLITQAAGRAGRGKAAGKVVVQTYNPEHYAIIHGANHDYHSFYDHEIVLRKQLFYPPYSNLIKLSIQNREEKIAIAQAEEIANILRKNKLDTNDQILGPFAPTIAKFKEIYRINIIIKTNNSALIKGLLIRYDINLRDDIMIDVNPINVM